jgi:hypothetical protein
MKKAAHLCAIFFIMVVSDFVSAQRPPARFGSVSEDLLEKNFYEEYPDAEAVVLFDFGKVSYTYSSNDGFQILIERQVRIKILNKDGLEWGDGKVELYKQSSSRETISKLNGITHNLDDGKIVSTKLSNRAVFHDVISENRTEVKFALPAVREGSVIEYSYTVTSDFDRIIPSWNFQTTIPVLYSEYNTRIPEYFTFKVLMKGYLPLSSHQEKSTPETFIHLEPAYNDERGNRVSSQTHRINLTSKTNQWISENVPAFKREPYMSSASDFMSGLEFELSNVNFPGSYFKNVTSTWDDIRKTLIESEYFGRQMGRSGFLSSLVKTINESYTDPRIKMIEAYSAIQDKMNWNERNRITITTTLREAFNKGEGSSADINMLLVVLLRELGLKANPLILSTRENGMIHPARIMLTKFNYLIAHVQIDGTDYLLDATDKNCPYFLIPFRCLNGQGRIISEESSDWIDLIGTHTSNSITMANLTFDSDNLLVGSIQKMRRNYAAYYFKQSISGDTDYQNRRKSLEDSFTGLQINDYQVENLDNIASGVRENLNVNISNVLNAAGDLIFFNPMLNERISDNPFKIEDRKYPVDFGHLTDNTYILNLEVPEGYEVDDLPEDLRMAMPDNSAAFNYQLTVMGNKIQIMSKFQINKTLFPYSDYKFLKSFYDEVVKKHSEQIVLKKL